MIFQKPLKNQHDYSWGGKLGDPDSAGIFHSDENVR
jgi:hypothetical protein